MATSAPTTRLRDYSNALFEIFVAVFSLAPILVLIYFYPKLPTRIPVFLNLQGEVEVWADKSVISVFRVALMAIDLQLLCLLMKYGTLHFRPSLPYGAEDFQRRALALGAGMWDWFRAAIAFKMAAESLSILFINDERMGPLKTVSWAVTWIASILGVAGALVYAYRLMLVRREMKKAFENISYESQVNKAHVYGGMFYYNRSDPAVFVEKYAVNFGNKWLYALVACLALYPVLVFSTS